MEKVIKTTFFVRKCIKNGYLYNRLKVLTMVFLCILLKYIRTYLYLSEVDFLIFCSPFPGY